MYGDFINRVSDIFHHSVFEHTPKQSEVRIKESITEVFTQKQSWHH